MHNASNLDFSETEARITDLLAGAQELDSSVHSAIASFEAILCDVLGLLCRKHSWRYWHLDALCCDSLSRSNEVVTLQGTSDWLTGGDGCELFRLDVALGTDPLLYSFKFTNSKSGKQTLYVGKTPSGWVVNGA
jgi:hypothetical protein